MNSSRDIDFSAHPNCTLSIMQRGEFDVIAILRIIMASLSIMGALSIVCSAIYRKTVCNPKVHPIFVLSIVDAMLGVMWIIGSTLWLGRHLYKYSPTSVNGCFALNIVTVVHQCVAMNVTLIYALLAYSSIKQRDFSHFIMQNAEQFYVHVWPPMCSFIAYFIAWTLPVALVVTPFVILSIKFNLLSGAKAYTCWCLPFYGNVLPRPSLGYDTNKERDHYLHHLHYYVASYSAVLILNFAIVFVSMLAAYCGVFHRINKMRFAQEHSENTPLHVRATQAMIFEGQKDARNRVLFFLSIFFLTGAMTFISGVIGVGVIFKDHHYYENKTVNHEVMTGIFYLLLVEAASVPLQGFLNALAYGWTRGDFLSVMSNSSQTMRDFSQSHSHSYGTVKRRKEEQKSKEEEEEPKLHELIADEREGLKGDTDVTPPGTP